MKVSCPSCHTNYNIDDKRIPPSGAKLKCAKCQTTFPIKPQAAAPGIGASPLPSAPPTAGAVPLPGSALRPGAGAVPLPGMKPPTAAPAAGAIPLPGTAAPARGMPAPPPYTASAIPLPGTASPAPIRPSGGAIPLPGAAPAPASRAVAPPPPSFSQASQSGDFDDDPFGDKAALQEQTRIQEPSEDLLRYGKTPAPVPGVATPSGFDWENSTKVMTGPLPVESFREPPSFGALPPEPGTDGSIPMAGPSDFVFQQETRPPSGPMPTGFDFPPSPPSPELDSEDKTQLADVPAFPFGAPTGPGQPMDLSGLPPPVSSPPADSMSSVAFDDLPGPAGKTGSHEVPMDFSDLPGPSASTPSASPFGSSNTAAPSSFGEIDLGGGGGSDPLEADLNVPPSKPAQSGSADGLSMMGFIDDAAKNNQAAAPKKEKGKRYHVRRRSGKVFGPFEEGVVGKMLQDGQLLGNEDVSLDGENWSPMASVPSFAQAIQKMMDSPAQKALPPPEANQGPSGNETMDRLKQLYEGRMATVSVVSRRNPVEKLRKRVPLIVGLVVALALAGGGFGMAFTRYGVFGLKKLAPARVAVGSQEYQDLVAARKALLGDTFKSYRDARDITARILARREYPEVRATWCQAIFYLQRRYGAVTANEQQQASASLEEIELLGTKHVDVVKAMVGNALARKVPAEALLLLMEAKSRAENDSDLELDLLLAETHAARGEGKVAQEVLTKVIAKDKGNAKALHALGNYYQNNNQADLAAKAYADALQADPTHAISAVELAAIELLFRKNVAEGSRALDAALSEQMKPLLGPSELARARTLRGVALSGQFKTKEAIVEFDEALKLDHDSTFTKAMLARSLLIQREYERALPLYKEAATREPQNLEYADGYLTALISVGKMEDALNAVAAANSRFPSNARIAYLYGRVNDALDNSADAEGHYKRAINADPALVDAYLALGKLYLRFKRIAEAKQPLEQALAKAPQNPAAHAGLGELAFAEGNLAKAKQSFDKAVELDPSLAEGHLGLSKVSFANGEIEAARAEVDKALDQAAHLKDGRLQRGLVMWKQGQLEGAIGELKKAKEEDPKSTKIAITLGAVNLEKGDLASAESSLVGALNAEPSNAEAHFYMARVKAKRLEFTQAIEHMKTSLEHAPKRADYHYEMGVILRDAKKLNDAMEEWRLAIKQDPAYADAYEALGSALLEKGDVENAVRTFELTLKADPKRTRVFGLLGDCFFQATKWDQAIARYQKALAVDPGLKHVYYKVGRAYTEEGKHGEAVVWYQKATALDSNNAMPYYYLGFAYKEQGKKSAAVAAFKSYLAKRPEAEDKKEIEDEIYDLSQ